MSAVFDPSNEIIDSIVARVARDHAGDSNGLCRALRRAAELGWRAHAALTDAERMIVEAIAPP
ncbi:MULTISPECIES: hypothetical protein [Sphingomonas]|uniref:hypothetical protein n=1 Tax=Sphingomonas TaxID=13687 RepID=UPI000836B2BF|nr:hypothetical protein [Sphingomonas sp. CCH10-B3]